MTTARSWKAKDPAEAFFPVEMRPLFMPTADGLDKFQQLKRHFAVVDVERENPFAVVTDDYELVTNKAAYDMAAEVMKKVFPQGDNIPASWVTMIADGDAKKAKAIQETHVHKLGNLTISGFNSALGNKSFKDKRDRTDSKGREVGYKNGLKLNAELATAEGWSVVQIDARTTTLVDQVMSLFALTEGQPCA